MIYLAYIVTGFTLIQLIIAVINLLTRVKPGKEAPLYDPLISILIPARNEQENIGNILNDLSGQDYRNLEIIVFNDQSEDNTAEIVSQFHLLDRRIRLINSDELPENWLGKNYACYSLSRAAGGDYLLFLDADVRIGNGIIAGTVAYARRLKLALVSIFPRQEIISFGEMITVPVMNFILLSLLPLILVRKSSYHSLAAANGQFMLFNAHTYRDIDPHLLMRSEKVEDIKIARYLKKTGHSVACLTGNDLVRCRMYKGFREAINGFSKNVTCYFGESRFLSALFWLITTFGFIPVSSSMPLMIIFLYIFSYLVIRILISITSEQKIIFNLLFFIPQQIALGIMIYRAITSRFNKGYQWKGRSLK